MDELPLDVFSPDQAFDLLGRETAEAQSLAKTLGYLPLALAHARTFCQLSGDTLSAYEQKAKHLITIAPPGAHYERSVFATFDLAIQQAARRSQDAAALMAFVARCAPARIPVPLMRAAVSDDSKLSQAISLLVELSLLKLDPLQDRTIAFSMHPLVRTVASDWAHRVDLAVPASKQLADHLLELFSGRIIRHSPRLYSVCVQHARAIIDQREHYGVDYDLAAMLAHVNEPLYRGDYETERKNHGLNHKHTIKAGAYLACILLLQHNRKEAFDILEGLFTARTQLHPSDPLFADYLEMFVQALYMHGGGSSHAGEVYARALQIRQTAPSPDDLAIGDTLCRFAAWRGKQDDRLGGLDLCKRALDLFEKRLGLEHPKTADVLFQTALLLPEHEIHLARHYLGRCLAIHDLHLGSTDPKVLSCLLHFISFAMRSRDFNAALPMLIRYLLAAEKDNKATSNDALHAVGCLIGIHALKGDFDKVSCTCRKAIAMYKKRLESFDPSLDEVEDHRDYFRKILDIYKSHDFTSMEREIGDRIDRASTAKINVVRRPRNEAILAALAYYHYSNYNIELASALDDTAKQGAKFQTRATARAFRLRQ